MKKLPRDFYLQDTVTIARELLGCVLWRKIGRQMLGARLVETEAYLGANDMASHARRGLRSPRNESMYLQGGHAYVYFTYGMHWCMNVVTQETDLAEAVLLRAAEPVQGIEAMRKRRPKAKREFDLMNGPGKLCAALQIDKLLDGEPRDGPQVTREELIAADVALRNPPAGSIADALQQLVSAPGARAAVAARLAVSSAYELEDQDAAALAEGAAGFGDFASHGIAGGTARVAVALADRRGGAVHTSSAVSSVAWSAHGVVVRADGAELALAGGGGDDEEIGESGRFADVEECNVAGLLVGRNFDDLTGYRRGVVFGRPSRFPLLHHANCSTVKIERPFYQCDPVRCT